MWGHGIVHPTDQMVPELRGRHRLAVEEVIPPGIDETPGHKRDDHPPDAAAYKLCGMPRGAWAEEGHAQHHKKRNTGPDEGIIAISPPPLALWDRLKLGDRHGSDVQDDDGKDGDDANQIGPQDPCRSIRQRTTHPLSFPAASKTSVRQTPT